ncbi:acyl CoA--acetate/3-ketoacid CoA transferase subunit beta [Rhizorhabdus wittichii]|uniref:acyl CoA--acetate/3-ketoacid CoA transferase subunit beta n=1 Tax=Rhizorhabdus wittichii TaxID=160791 RepID=UPI00030D701F|nr:acyl CoA--acetate/3-ketoacid CoA transferase subunit beta [Rhizorhabdus wittichii]
MARHTLTELIIARAAKAWADDPEWLATGITPVPRLAAGLAKTLYNPRLMITDGENWFARDPVPLGPRDGFEPVIEGWAPYLRTFDNLWNGRRHAMVAPVQIDRYGQTNISVIGDHAQPKAALLGARGFPGNSIHHPNSFFFPAHNKRAFVEGEVDYVCMAGYNPARWPGGRKPFRLELRLILTNLCVMDFGGPDHAIRLVSLHPGVSFEEVQDNTGFPIHRDGGETPETSAPTDEELAVIARLDPHDVRATIIKGNPPGRPEWG